MFFVCFLCAFWGGVGVTVVWRGGAVGLAWRLAGCHRTPHIRSVLWCDVCNTVVWCCVVRCGVVWCGVVQCDVTSFHVAIDLGPT